MTKERRVHCTIDRLPKDLVAVMLRMVVDGEWPSDCEQTWPGKPRYADVAAYAGHKGPSR